MDRITVAILAGGESRRLGGVDKGLHLLHGRPLVAWVCSAVERMGALAGPVCAIRPVIVANRNVDVYLRHAETISDLPDIGAGPLAGLASVMAFRSGDRILSLPVDSPMPPDDLLIRLSASLRDCDCAVAHAGEHRQPLFALYRPGLQQSASIAARAGKGPLAWQSTLRHVGVDFSDQPSRFDNLNSERDFARFAREHRR